MKNKPKKWEKIAKQFHDTYEELAPFYGYITRKDTRKFNPKSQNGKLMMAVCKKVIKSQREQAVKEVLGKIEKELAMEYEAYCHLPECQSSDTNDLPCDCGIQQRNKIYDIIRKKQNDKLYDLIEKLKKNILEEI